MQAEVMTMRLTLWIIVAITLAVPAMVVAIALGPVIVGILCAVGFGLIVFTIGNLVIALVTGVERAGSRLVGHR
jgi:hypothetical protein